MPFQHRETYLRRLTALPTPSFQGLQWLQALHEAFGSTQEQQEKMVHALSQVEAGQSVLKHQAKGL